MALALNLDVISRELESALPVDNDWNAVQGRGVRSIPLSMDFFRLVTMDQVIADLKAVLPPDARILNVDGERLRMSTRSASGWGARVGNCFYLLVSSAEWDALAPGEFYPEMDIWHLSPGEMKREEDDVPLAAIAIHGRTDYEITIDKKKHEVIYENEDEGRLKIVLRALDRGDEVKEVR